MVVVASRGRRWGRLAPFVAPCLVKLPWPEVQPFVEASQLNVARLLLLAFVFELRQPFRRHPEQIDEFVVRGVVHEYLDQRLDEPGARLVVSVAGEPGDGAVSDHHVLPGGPGPVQLLGGLCDGQGVDGCLFGRDVGHDVAASPSPRPGISRRHCCRLNRPKVFAVTAAGLSKERLKTG